MPLTPERWQQVAAIYEQAVDRDSSERYAFLSQACAGDEELRREVEALLRQEAVHGILDRPVWAIAAPCSPVPTCAPVRPWALTASTAFSAPGVWEKSFGPRTPG